MGWTFFKDSGLDTKDIVYREVEQVRIPGERTGYEILDFSARGRVVYMVVRTTSPDADKVHEFGCVMLTARNRGDFGYKWIDESMGPYAVEAPLRIINYLDAHSPVEEGSGAHGWRAAVRAWHQKRREGLSLQAGQTVEFTPPVKFPSFVDSRFRVVKQGRAVRFVSVSTGILCRITGWRDRKYIVEAAAI